MQRNQTHHIRRPPLQVAEQRACHYRLQVSPLHQSRPTSFRRFFVRFIPLASWKSLLLSVFSMHNETSGWLAFSWLLKSLTSPFILANIHTHLMPLLFILSFTLPAFSFAFLPSSGEHYPFHFSSTLLIFTSIGFTSTLRDYLPSFITSVSAVAVDAVPRYLFLGAASACLACSTLWHLSNGCSDVRVLENGARTDYAGIGW